MRDHMFVAVAAAWLAMSACSDGTDPGGDQDGDGISNGDEGVDAGVNTDGDAYEDWLDRDSDGDGIPDEIEAGDGDLATPPIDTDGDGAPDFRDTDADGDGLDDRDEIDPWTGDVVDTDGDGAFDFQDTDSDGDGIPDAVESSFDTNEDGVADRRALDSDGDCISDTSEAGPNPASPRHSDNDGLPDYRDLDSDGDGLPDVREDANCDGVLDPGESSPVSSDTDGDGTPDLVEVIAGSNPNDPNSNIPPGDFYFVLPFMGPGAQGPLDFATSIRQADIFFSVDTTGSFNEEIQAIRSTLETTIIPGVSAVIPNAAFGVGRFEDFPLAPFGLAGDKPFELLRSVTTDPALVAMGLAALAPASGGLDTPESGYEALYQWSTGLGLPAFGYPPFAPPGIGGVGFRADSLPIIVQVTDAASHQASEYPAATGAHSRDQAVQALTAIGIRVIGIDSLQNLGTPADPRAQLEDVAIASSAVIPPDGANRCATGVNGATRPAVNVGGGTLGCPLVFDVLADGTGLGSLIVDAIAQLAQFGVLDISTALVGQTAGIRGEVLPPGTTTADFITSVTPVAPPPAGAIIDGDIFRNVTPGSMVTFEVQAFNDFVPEIAEPQLFAIDIHVLGDAVTLLDVRRVFVVVPERIVVIGRELP